MLPFALFFWLGCLCRAHALSLYMPIALLTFYYLFSRQIIYLIGFLIGFLYTILYFYLFFSPTLSPSYWNQWLDIYGTVQSIPITRANNQSFLFKVNHIYKNGISIAPGFKQTIYLSDYERQTEFVPARHYQLRVKIKPVRGFKNDGGIDREKLMLAKGIVFQGYVKQAKVQQENESFNFLSLQWRLSKKIEAILKDSKTLGLIEALSLGLSSHLSMTQRDIFRNTGTSHLMAISGLHVGLVASICYIVFLFLWTKSEKLCLLMAAPRASAIFAILMASIYCGITGFQVSAKRALVMLSVFFLGRIFLLEISQWSVYAIALFIVLILNPFSVLSVGFYLSFYAVFILIIFMENMNVGMTSLIKLQLVLMIALSPLSIFYFSYFSFISLPANLLAIPLVSWVLVPILLLSSIMLFCMPFFAKVGFLFSEKLMEGLLNYLSFLNEIGRVWHFNDLHITTSQFLFLLLSIGFFLLPKSLRLMPFALIFLLPVFWPYEAMIKNEQAVVIVFDVGQGSSVLIRTKDNVVLYDAGPKWYGFSDAAKRVILPYMRQHKIKKIDRLIISHRDLDHRGGVESLEKAVMINAQINNDETGYSSCFNTKDWQYNGVKFSFLKSNRRFHSQNNRSCVLRVQVGQNAFLLTGDIEKKAELFLLQHENKAHLRANILLAPHHGSLSSSTPAFVQAVSPKSVIFSTGFLNRYAFPKTQVIERYQGKSIYNTADCGMVSFLLTKKYQNPTCLSQK